MLDDLEERSYFDEIFRNQDEEKTMKLFEV